MAQPYSTRLVYLGAVTVTANEPYLANDLASVFTGATAFMMKSRGIKQGSTYKKPQVSIIYGSNVSPKFEVDYGEISAFESALNLKYVFDQDCTIVVLKELGSVV